MVHLAPQLHNLIVGTRGLVKLFGQVEVLVVELSIVLRELVQLLLQISDDLWDGCREGTGELDIRKGHYQQGNASRISDFESRSEIASHSVITGTNLQLWDWMPNPSSLTNSLIKYTY